eukprot:2393395-Rhodomonas_salina.1
MPHTSCALSSVIIQCLLEELEITQQTCSSLRNELLEARLQVQRAVDELQNIHQSYEARLQTLTSTFSSRRRSAPLNLRDVPEPGLSHLPAPLIQQIPPAAVSRLCHDDVEAAYRQLRASSHTEAGVAQPPNINLTAMNQNGLVHAAVAEGKPVSPLAVKHPKLAQNRNQTPKIRVTTQEYKEMESVVGNLVAEMFVSARINSESAKSNSYLFERAASSSNPGRDIQPLQKVTVQEYKEMEDVVGEL